MKPASAGIQRRRRAKKLLSRQAQSKRHPFVYKKHSLHLDFIPEPGHTYIICDAATGQVLFYDIYSYDHEGFSRRKFYLAPIESASDEVYGWKCGESVDESDWDGILSPVMRRVDWGNSTDQVNGQLKMLLDDDGNTDLFASKEVKEGDGIMWSSWEHSMDGCTKLQKAGKPDLEDVKFDMFFAAIEHRDTNLATHAMDPDFLELVRDRVKVEKDVEWIFVRAD